MYGIVCFDLPYFIYFFQVQVIGIVTIKVKQLYVSLQRVLLNGRLNGFFVILREVFNSLSAQPLMTSSDHSFIISDHLFHVS